MHAQVEHRIGFPERRQDSGHAARRFSVFGEAAWLVIFGACVLEGGCRGHVPTVWRAELPSPDGHWIAIAETQQVGGPGTNSIVTSVMLKPTIYSNPPMQVLAFDCQGPVPRPYVLDNVANAGGTINLKMSWLSTSHLEVTYSGHPDLYFQMARIWGIDVSVRYISDEAPKGSNTP
jgi:hypothetical protein